jgi:hypothetical protein
MRLIDADKLKEELSYKSPAPDFDIDSVILGVIDEQPTASPWHRVEEPPEEAGEYIVAYHPCWWDDVKTQVTKVGIDSFRGKASWAKRKTQRVTHWMEKPEPPKEDA